MASGRSSVAVRGKVGGVIGLLPAIPFAGALKVGSHEVVGWRRGHDAPT